MKISINDDRKSLRKKIQDKLINCKYVLIDKINDETVSRIIDSIRKFKPVLIYSYSSSLGLMADYLEKRNEYVNVKAIVTTGDNLIPSSRRKIEKFFNTRVYDEYGCGGEGLYIAAQCDNGTYHINDELLIVEEENGEIIITSLFNYAMPLIRYKLGDLITLDEGCKCGRNLSVIKSINGRDTDIIKTKSGDKLIVHFFTGFFEYILGISTFKIIQESIEGITVQIVKNEKYNQLKDEREIINYIHKNTGKDFQIKFEYVKEIPLEKTGKRKFIVSNIK